MITSPGFQNCPKFRGEVEVMRHVVVSKPGDETQVGATPVPTSVRDRRLCARKQGRKNAERETQLPCGVTECARMIEPNTVTGDKVNHRGCKSDASLRRRRPIKD
jgi:hypothetical protein